MIVEPGNLRSEPLNAVPNGGLFWKAGRAAGEVVVGMVSRFEGNTDGSGAIVWLTGPDAFSIQPFTGRVTTSALRVPVGPIGIELKTPLVGVQQNWTRGHLLIAADGAHVVVQGNSQGFAEAFYIRTSDWTISGDSPADVGIEVAEWRLVTSVEAQVKTVIASVGEWG